MLARASVLSVACFAVFLAKPYGIHAQPWGPVWGDAGGRTIQVGAVGEVVTEPDFAILDLGIDSRGVDSGRPAVTMTRECKWFSRRSGPSAWNPKTCKRSQVHVAIEVEHDREGKASDIYVYRKGFRVVVRDFKNLEAVLNGLLDAGINRVNRVEFDTTRRPARNRGEGEGNQGGRRSAAAGAASARPWDSRCSSRSMNRRTHFAAASVGCCQSTIRRSRAGSSTSACPCP